MAAGGIMAEGPWRECASYLDKKRWQVVIHRHGNRLTLSGHTPHQLTDRACGGFGHIAENGQDVGQQRALVLRQTECANLLG